MTAPPSATISPAAWKPVSLATAAPNPLLLLVLTLVLVRVVLAPTPLVPACEVTGHAVVQGMSLVNGRLFTLLAEAKAGAWDAMVGFGCALGPCGFSTLSMTWMTPLAIRMSACRSWAELM